MFLSLCFNTQEPINTVRPVQSGRCLADDISNAIYWIKICEFQLKFHWSVNWTGVQLIINQNWIRHHAITWNNEGQDTWRHTASRTINDSILFYHGLCFAWVVLTYWDRVTHICVSKLNHHWFRTNVTYHEFRLKIQQYKKINEKCRLQNCGHFVWGSKCWTPVQYIYIYIYMCVCVLKFLLLGIADLDYIHDHQSMV